MKVVLNKLGGGSYGISSQAVQELQRRGVILNYNFYNRYPDLNHYTYYENDRSNPDLVAVVEHLGPLANGESAKLVIIDIPSGVCFHTVSCHGVEHIEENYRTWY